MVYSVLFKITVFSMLPAGRSRVAAGEVGPMCRATCVVALMIVAEGALLGSAAAQQTTLPPEDAAAFRFFESRIRPILIEKCYQCHSSKSDAVKGGLLLDHRQAVLTGGDSGPALVPGKPDESLLLQAIQYESLEMPPDGQLPNDVIASFRTWIARGAPDPRTVDPLTVDPLIKSSLIKSSPKGRAAERNPARQPGESTQFWSFQPPRRRAPPALRDATWPVDPIDHFILARLEENGLHPTADSKPINLVRRLYLDLLGLPPSPVELEHWVRRVSAANHAARYFRRRWRGWAME